MATEDPIIRRFLAVSSFLLFFIFSALGCVWDFFVSSLIPFFPSTVIFIIVYFRVVEILNRSAGHWSLVLILSLVFL